MALTCQTHRLISIHRLEGNIYRLVAAFAFNILIKFGFVKDNFILMALIFLIFSIVHVNIWSLIRLFEQLGAKYFLTYAHRSELHLIASQRACLIRKDIVQLPQILYNTHILDLGSLVLFNGVHFNIARDKPRDKELDHFRGDIQRNRNEGVEQLYVPDESKKALKDRRVAKLNVKVHRLTIFLLLGRLTMPIATQNGDRSRQDELRNENLNDEHVHLLLNITLLVAAKLWVHHYTRLLACVNHGANDPFRVLKLSAFQKKLLLGQWEELVACVHFAVEGVEVAIWGLCHDLTRY